MFLRRRPSIRLLNVHCCSWGQARRSIGCRSLHGAAAPELLAKAQRWEPAEAIGHCSPRSSPAAKHPQSGPGAKRPGSPPARPSAWDGTVSSIPAPTQRALRTLEWIHRHGTSSYADHQAPARPTSLKRSARPPSMPATRSQSRAPRSARAPPGADDTAPRRSGGSCAPTSS